MESTKLDCIPWWPRLLAAGLIATGSFPVLSTVAALVGIAAMIYGVVAGVMVVFNRDNDGPPD
jgi:hypothetical protein